MCAARFAGLRPCGAGYAAALLYCGQPAVFVLPVFLAFSLAFDCTFATLFYALAVCAASFFAALLSLRFARAKRALFAVLLTAAQATLLLRRSQIGYLLMSAWGVLTLGVFVAAASFLYPVLRQKCRYKFLETELACGGALLICASLGLRGMRVFGFDACYLLAPFCILFALSTCSLSGGVAVGMCFGAGIALYEMQANAIAFFAFAALVAALFASAPRPLASLSVAAAFVLVSCLFASPPAWQQTVCFAVGALAFSLVREKTLASVRDALFAPASAAAARGIIHRTSAETGRKLLGASRIFTDMQQAMEQVPEEQREESVLEQKVCLHCPQYETCRAQSGYKEALAVMERASAVKGRASVSEIPSLLSSCVRLSALVNEATASAQTRQAQLLRHEAKREGRKIVAQQLSLMSGVLRQLGEQIKTPARFDAAKEKQIKDELSYRGAAVPEVIVTEDAVSVVLQSDGLSQDRVAATIGKIMHAPYRYVHGGADVLPGFSLQMYARAPRYDVAFSAAGVAKEGKSGDNHSFVRLGGDRFMMALCDGMGSGEEAEKASETAIELVESFFRAGLDSMAAVECVNRFLALNECDRFSTLDVTVIDLNSGNAEILKLSSPATVIKSRGGVRAVSGASLPMGVFEEVTCGQASVRLCAGDEVVMATDGVTDALGSVEGFISAVATQACADPQAEAKSILATAAGLQNGKLRDDGTVLCARIFEKKIGYR